MTAPSPTPVSTSEGTPMDKTLNDIAPYPQTEEQATADVLARHLAVMVQQHQLIIDKLADDTSELGKRLYVTTIGVLVNEYGGLKLLRELIQHAPAEADRVARELWMDWNDGSSVGENAWHWMQEEYGISPDEVTRIADEMWRRHEAKKAA